MFYCSLSNFFADAIDIGRYATKSDRTVRVSRMCQGCRDSLMGSPKLKQKVPITKIGDVGQLSDYERGPWHERIPLFKHGALPHDGNEIQSEYFVHRKHAAKAIRAVSSVGSRLQGVLKISEVSNFGTRAFLPRYIHEDTTKARP